VRDRYLFSADRQTSEYKHVLEITPRRARLLVPSGSAQQWRWLLSVGIFLGYLALTWPASILIMIAISQLPTLAAWLVVVSAIVLWFGVLFLVFHIWDRKSLLFLADEWTQATDVVLLGARSFGTFQEVRARTRMGDEFHLIVDARGPRFWEAVRLLERRPAASG
jgi:hypothetical protein